MRKKPLDRANFADSLHRTDAENRLRVYGDYISKIATLPSPSDTDEEPASIRALKELARLAYSTSDAELSSLTDKTRSQLRTRLTSAFAKLIKRPEDSPYLCETILSIDPSEIKMDDEIESGLADALGRLKKLLKPTKKKKTKKSATKQRPTEGLALLYAVAILQLYNGEPDALEILEDLQECFDKLQSKQAGDDSGTSESLIEILLSLVARPSALMRQVSQQVFAAFSSTITAGGLALLTEPLAAGEGAKGQQALFNIEDEMMEDAEEDGTASDNDDADDDESELDSDVEIVDLEESAGGDEDEEGDDGSDDAEETHEDTDEDDDMEQLRDLEALDDALAKVLGSHRLDKDAEAESSDEDEDMSDSEMMALDDKLASVFKQRIKRAGNKNKENKNAKETVVNFKNRVLDLLDIYVHEQAGNPLAF
ncbi:MAG: DNA polymerase V family protein, partial [Thaumarchaeota archaeon]|nr:DNA polymerase V family protein [Nitrososphaerota archaeon]